MNLLDTTEVDRRSNVQLALEAIKEVDGIEQIEAVAKLMKVIHRQSAALATLADRRNWAWEDLQWKWRGNIDTKGTNPLKIATEAMDSES